MPAKKPIDLHTRHATKAEKEARVDSEESMAPERELPSNPPARLARHEAAATIWRRLVRLYDQLEAKVVTRLDQDLLVDYCILMEQVTELDQMRKTAYQVWLELSGKHETLLDEAKAIADKAQAADKRDEAVAVAISIVGAFEAVVKLDSRVDRKRALLYQWRQSLYLTPRARAGAAPSKKEKEIPPDDLEMLLNEASEAANGDGK